MFPEGHEENEDPNAGQQITTKVTNKEKYFLAWCDKSAAW